MTCLRHRFSGFVWQQEARPLSILETNKPEKPLQPSEPPQRNPAPTWLRKTFTRQRKKKSFHQLCPKLRIKAVLCSRTAGHPARLSHRTGMSPAPRRTGAVPGCLQRLVQRRCSRRRRRRSGGRGAARLRVPRERAAAQAPGARQPTTLRQGEGRDADTLREQDARTLSWERRKRHARQAHGSLLRSRAEPPPCRQMLPEQHRPPPGSCSARQSPAPSHPPSCGGRFYILFGTTLARVPTADPMPAPKAKLG